jgi:hypothetical protein
LLLFGRLPGRPVAAYRRLAGPPPRVAVGPAPTGRASPVNLTHSPFDAGPPYRSGHCVLRFWEPSPAPRWCRRVGGFRPAVTLSVAGCRGPGLRENPELDWLAAGATGVESVRAAIRRAERGEGTAADARELAALSRWFWQQFSEPLSARDAARYSAENRCLFEPQTEAEIAADALRRRLLG